MTTPPDRSTRRLRGRGGRGLKLLLLGILLGLAIPFLFRFLVDATGLADWAAWPLQRRDTAGDADAIVVLGAAVDRTCELSESAYRRTLLAVRLFTEGRGPLLLFTGGPTESSDWTPVSRHMADLARSLGVPESAIIEEDRSMSTWENASFSSPLLRERGVQRILLVTDSLHMGRAEACFQHFGFHIDRASVPPMCVSSDNLDLLRYAAHEYAAWTWYAIKGYGSSAREDGTATAGR